MFHRFLMSVARGTMVSFLATHVLLAQATQVKIIGPAATHTTHDITTIALDLGEMLNAAPGYGGSSASATILAGRSLMESYYHPEQKGATRGVLDTKHDYVVILPEVYFLHWIPEATFDGVLQMSRRALNAGSTPLLLMPRGDTYPLSVLSENSYRIGNGSGIATVPGGHAVDSASGLSSPGTDPLKLRQQAYLLAATLFNQITGINAATGTTYAPSDVGTATDLSSLAGKAAAAVTTHASTVHYTTSRHLSGVASYRTITPPSNRVRYAFTGTSTENGISDRLDELIQASGHIAAPHARPTSDGLTWTQTVFDRTKATFDAAPNEYLFLYGRDTQISAQSLIAYNQANLIPIFVDRHYDGVQTGDLSTRILLRDLHERTDNIFSYHYYQGWKGMFLHLGHARLNDIDSSIFYSSDGTHMTSENYYMAAAMMFTSALGKDPTPPSTLTAKQLKGFNVGKQMAKELAFLSETMAFTPESSLAIVPPAPLEKARWENFSQTFTASGGVPPYTWTESSAAGLPAGLSLSAGGVLSGAVTSSPQTRKLVIKVTDSAGAIHKVPFVLNVTPGVGSLSVTPATTFSVAVPFGGPVPSTTTQYTLSNPGLTSIQWAATKTAPWLTLNLSNGTLAAGASAVLTATINSNANSLAIGTYTDTIALTNTANGFGNTTIGVNLRIVYPAEVITNVGTNTWTVPAGVYSATIQAWGGGGAGGSAKSTGGTISSGGGAGGSYAQVTMAVTPGQTYQLIVGAGGVSSTNVTVNGSVDSAQQGGTSQMMNLGMTTAYVKAVGGAGGKNAVSSDQSGGLGTTNGCIGDVVYSGGNGAAGDSSGGGGGGGAGDASNGTNAVGINFGAGGLAGGGNGSNGRGASAAGNPASNASAPGGGGGGVNAGTGVANRAGAGGAGKIIVSYNTMTFTLDTNAINGSITLNPPGGDHPSGTIVTATASPNPGYNFTSWNGSQTGSINPATIVMDSNKTVTATFYPKPFVATIQTAGSGGGLEISVGNLEPSWVYELQTTTSLNMPWSNTGSFRSNVTSGVWTIVPSPAEPTKLFRVIKRD